MSYTFTKIQVGRFFVHRSAASAGDEHKKRFIEPGITPMRQATFNVYVRGEFEFGPESGPFVNLSGGDTSLSLPDVAYPVGVVFVERATSSEALRYCISPVVSSPWGKRVLDVPAGESIDIPRGACAVVLSGKFTSDVRPACDEVAFAGPCKLSASSSLRLALAE